MLRASLFAMSACAFVGLLHAPAVMAGPSHHPHHRPVMRMPVAVAPVAVRPNRPVVRQVVARRPVFIGVPQPFFPIAGYARTVLVQQVPAGPVLQDGEVTINRIPVVMGIRRAPEAAPVIYRIGDGRDGRAERHEGRRRMSPSARVHHVVPDTTTPRIVVVRSRQRD